MAGRDPANPGLRPAPGGAPLFMIPARAVLLDRAAADGRRPGRRVGEGMSGGAATDRSLARLAQAILVPPFPGVTVPGWLLAALGRGLAGVTLFGANVS